MSGLNGEIYVDYLQRMSNQDDRFLFLVLSASGFLTLNQAIYTPINAFNTDVLSFHTAITINSQVSLQLLSVMAEMAMHKKNPAVLATRSGILKTSS